jgi:plastocyanin
MRIPRILGLVPVGLAAFAVAQPLIARSAGERGTGSIAGQVTFQGTAPARAGISMASAPDCKRKFLDESVIVGADGGLADVHVRIQNGTAGSHTPASTPIAIDQKDCMYRPRVAGAMAGQEFLITNSDPTLHNVHAYRDKATLFNRSQPAKTAGIKPKKLPKAGELFTLKCDVHSWMTAFVPITDHPFFDVTGEDGVFEIAGVPAKRSFTLEAWHPKYGLKSQTVQAGDRKVSFQFP